VSGADQATVVPLPGTLSIVQLPFFYFNLEPADRARLAAKMPPPLTQQLIPVDWKDAWAPMRPFFLP
jgi:hypothetical protein